MRLTTIRRATLTVVLLASGCSGVEGQDAGTNTATADESVQTRQLRAVAQRGDSIDDKLFVLWEYAGALRERELAKAVLSKADDL